MENGMSQSSSNITRGYPVALLSAVVLSTTAIVVRYLTVNYGLPPLVLAFWRACFATSTLFLVFCIFRPKLLRVTRVQLVFLVFHGLVLSVFNSSWTLSVALNGAAVSNVLVYCSTAFTALLGWWLLKERLTAVKLIAVVVCLGGTVFVSQAIDPAVWNANFLGILTGVFSGLGYAVYSLMGRSASNRGLDPWSTLFYSFGFAALFLGLFNLLPGNIPGTAAQLSDFFWLGSAWAGWGIIFLLAAGPTILGFGLYNVSLSYLPSSTANLILTLEPVLTMLWAFALLGERMTLLQIAGSLMILAGVVLLRVFEGQHTPAADKPAPGKEIGRFAAD